MPRPRPIKLFRGRRGLAGSRGQALFNLGPKSSAWLAAIGVQTREQLLALGPIETCRRLRAAGFPVSVLMAYALEGALTGTHWQAIPFETKQWLRAEFAKLKTTRSRAG